LRWRIQGFPEDDNTTVRPQLVRDAERIEHSALRAAARAFGEGDEFSGAHEHGTGHGFTSDHGELGRCVRSGATLRTPGRELAEY
jgi:hypothetical protein